MDIDLKDYKWH